MIVKRGSMDDTEWIEIDTEITGSDVIRTLNSTPWPVLKFNTSGEVHPTAQG